MAVTVWAIRRTEASNGRVGLVTVADAEAAGRMVKAGDAQPLSRNAGRLARVDSTWPEGLREKLAEDRASGGGKKRGRPPKAKPESEGAKPEAKPETAKPETGGVTKPVTPAPDPGPGDPGKAESQLIITHPDPAPADPPPASKVKSGSGKDK